MSDKEEQSDKAPMGPTPANDTHEHKLLPLLEAMEQAHYGRITMAAK